MFSGNAIINQKEIINGHLLEGVNDGREIVVPNLRASYVAPIGTESLRWYSPDNKSHSGFRNKLAE